MPDIRLTYYVAWTTNRSFVPGTLHFRVSKTNRLTAFTGDANLPVTVDKFPQLLKPRKPADLGKVIKVKVILSNGHHLGRLLAIVPIDKNPRQSAIFV